MTLARTWFVKKTNGQLTDPEPHHDIEAITAKFDRYEERIRSLEDDRLRVKAWAALIVFAGSIAAFLVGKLFPM
jgi:hypothetical protein